MRLDNQALDEGKVRYFMSKFRIVMLALFVVSALGAVFAVSASAEVTLLAEWLVSGVDVAAGVEEASETSGEIKLEDTAAASAVLCSAILDGALLSNGLDLVTKILHLDGTEVTELGGALPLTGTGGGPDCVTGSGCAEGTVASPLKVWPLGLPWHTLLFLAENGTFLDSVSKENGTTFGYELECLVGGLPVSDTCEATSSAFEVINDADTGDAAIPAGAQGLPLAKCSLFGGNTALNEADSLSEILVTSGLLLTVSSV
jgi:hypothetical protein